MKINGYWKTARAAILALTAACTTTVANAANITRTFDLVASDFGASAPVQSVTLDFTVTFDPLTNTDTTTKELIVNSFTLPDSSEFDYTPQVMVGVLPGPADALTVGTDIIAPFTTGVAANQYVLGISDAASATPQAEYFDYFTGNAPGDIFAAGQLSLTATDVSSAPEPSSWLLVIAGVAVVGVLLRRREKIALPARTAGGV